MVGKTRGRHPEGPNELVNPISARCAGGWEQGGASLGRCNEAKYVVGKGRKRWRKGEKGNEKVAEGERRKGKQEWKGKSN